MTKPTRETMPSMARGQDQLSDIDLGTVNGGSRQTANNSFSSQIVQGAGTLLSGASAIAGHATSPSP